MLTEEALRERKWGRFPALRRVLEEKQVPVGYYGLTSVSDNMFESMQRVVELWVLSKEFRADIERAARTEGPEAIWKEVRTLEHELTARMAMFQDAVNDVRALSSALVR